MGRKDESFGRIRVGDRLFEGRVRAAVEKIVAKGSEDDIEGELDHPALGL